MNDTGLFHLIIFHNSRKAYKATFIAALLCLWFFSSCPLPQSEAKNVATKSSLEFGHATGHSDYCSIKTLPSDFGNGFLFSVWTKISQPIMPGTYRGNQNVLYIYGSNWSLLCLNGNIGQDALTGFWRYNANYEFLEGGSGDFCTYYSTSTENISLSECNGWVWMAWQVIVNPNQTITMRQWVKFGINGAVLPAGNTRYDSNYNVIGTLDPLGEETTDDLGFQPGNPSSFRLGHDNTYEGHNTPSNSYLCHARLEARVTKPSLAELDAIARSNAPDTKAWGDWELVWKDGSPDLSDRSGNGSDLSVQEGGELYEGDATPEF